jgi:hypothetical protein
VEQHRRKTSVEWPVVVDDRLRLLVSLVEHAGDAGATSASELLAALVCEQPIDGGYLAAQVNRYRQASAVELSNATRRHSAEGPTPRRGRPRNAPARRGHDTQRSSPP